MGTDPGRTGTPAGRLTASQRIRAHPPDATKSIEVLPDGEAVPASCPTALLAAGSVLFSYVREDSCTEVETERDA